MNLSSKELSTLERSVLEKGLKFAIAPRKIPTAEIVTAVEESRDFKIRDATASRTQWLIKDWD